ncbi:hypothetical protein L9F63_027958 [Diploptera punctata]|uniref:Abasic site processing protein HMCES n=1 Tax=Diploptera punctata TaxID=6984 RepID=A0AAD8EGT0_DIPPU|nr:hypothetical protein L9F63_027958 [Diploptera punctata]
MCGRTACTLCKEDVQKACSYKNKKTGKYELPKWGRNPKNKQQYMPSYNIAPTDITPIIVPGTNFLGETNRMLQPMMWGMIPPWQNGNYKSHGYSTHNCRFEGLLNSKLYSAPLNKGKRCVIVCDGFYEWKTKGGPRNPYFIHLPQEDGIHVEDSDTWINDWDEDNGWKGPKLLHMAGLYEIWTSPEGEEIYSYAMITMESDDTLSWLHHRMPVILKGQEIDDWLDVERISGTQAIHILSPIKKLPRELKWHPSVYPNE